MLNLEPYLIEFDSEKNIKEKMYFVNCYVKSISQKLVIVIPYNEYTFFANDKKIHKKICKRDIFLYHKKKDKQIIVSDFLLLFS